MALLAGLTRLLPEVELAGYLQVLLVFNTALPILACGLPDSLYSLIPKARSFGPRLFLENQILLFSFGLVSALILSLGLSDHLARFMGRAELSPDLRLVGWPLVFALPLLSISPLLLSLRKARELAGFLAVSRLTIFLFTLCLAMSSRTASGALWGMLIGNALAYVFSLVLCGRVLEGHWRGPYRTASEQLALGFPLLLSTSFGVIQTQLDRWLISFLGTLQEFAQYALIISFVALISNLTNPISKVLMTDVSRLFHRGRKQVLSKLIWKTVEMNLSVLLPIAVLCFFSSEFLITTIYSETYRGCAEGLRVAAFLLPARVLTFSSIEVAAGRSKFVPMIFGMNMLLTLSLTLLLFRHFGYLTVLYANLLVTYLFAIPAHLFVFARVLKIPLFSKPPSRALLKVLFYSLLPSLAFIGGEQNLKSLVYYLLILSFLFLLMPGESPWKTVLTSLRFGRVRAST